MHRRDASPHRIPIVLFNLLAALPKTPLWKRMEAEGRLIPDEHGDAARSEALSSCAMTNVRFKLPNDVVVGRTRPNKVQRTSAVARALETGVSVLPRIGPPPSGFIEPCIQTAARVSPSGLGWLHEIKHDGCRLIARLESAEHGCSRGADTTVS